MKSTEHKANGRRVSLRLIAVLTSCLLLAALPIRYFAEEALPQAQARDQMIRVNLTRLNLGERIDLQTSSPYTLLSNAVRMYIEADSELSFLLRNQQLILCYGDMRLALGQSATLTRNAGGENGGFTVTNYPALYQGSLRLDIADSRLRAILSIHVEDYLLGVVPYEMSDSFPLEALKAQAIAARTYALRHQNAARDYDVVDTTNDQVYRGYVKGSSNVERAVAETRGVCGFYKGALAQCYYSASNGGQTELETTVWPAGEALGYYAFGDDPYDVENPLSAVRRFTLQKNYGTEAAPYALRKLLADAFADELKALGFDPAPESVRVSSISDLTLSAPAGEQDTKRRTTLRLTATLSGRTRTDPPTVTDIDTDTEEIHMPGLFGMPEAGTPSPTVTPTAAPSPVPSPHYGPFTEIEKPFVLETEIFPMAESAFSMNISTNYQNEIWSVVEQAGAYILEARRYGHGVGMSQRGAEWMALQYGKDYDEIIAFYYPGMKLMRYPESNRDLPYPDAALEEAAGPAPSPTPRPTLMPVTEEAGAGQWFALVTGIDDDSSLNLRSVPDRSGDILMRLYKYQRLLVLERCVEEGWVKVRTDAAEGYVVESYLTKE